MPKNKKEQVSIALKELKELQLKISRLLMEEFYTTVSKDNKTCQ